ncbi:PilZ domain-containing protein, partial [Candidatus Omnitrophota bacterium]
MNRLDSLKEHRVFPRVSTSFPIKISSHVKGKAVNLSEAGLSLVLEEPLLLSKTKIKIQIASGESLQSTVKVVWSKQQGKESKFTYGVCFLKLKQAQLERLREALFEVKSFNRDFVNLTKNMRMLLTHIKNKF